MSVMGKQRVRKIILFSTLGIFVLSVILSLTIEPADYYKSLYSQTEKAQMLIDRAELGNANGQYSEYTVAAFSERVEEAKYIATEKSLKYSKIKPYYKEFQESLQVFKKAGNKDCLSKEEVLSLQKEGKAFEKTIILSENKHLKWSFSGKAVKEAAPINLDAQSGTLYQKEFENFIQRLDVTGSSITLLHNGALPCTAMLTLDYTTAHRDLQVYHYDGKTQKIGSMIRADSADGQISFPISDGGVYFILDVAVDNEEKTDQNLEEILEGAVEQAQKEKEEEKKQPSAAPASSERETDSKASESTSGPTASLVSSGQSSSQNASQKPAQAKKYCTVEIRCDTVVDTSKLTNPAVAKYVPKDGTILAELRVEIIEGVSAFEVLKRVTREEGIQMEFRMDPLYSGAYIEGINQLYEFDAGGGSGWMYKINGWFPNYGCSQYKMKDGDKMVWCYTCNIGKDVGDQYYDTHPDANPEYQ